MILQKKIVVTGHVQGVGFRYAVKQRADAFGLTGFVENKSDGSVEIVVCGSKDAVQEFIDWAKIGPSSARVRRVSVVEADAAAVKGFEIR